MPNVMNCKNVRVTVVLIVTLVVRLTSLEQQKTMITVKFSWGFLASLKDEALQGGSTDGLGSGRIYNCRTRNQ